MKKVLIKLLVLVGALSIGNAAFSLVRRENDAIVYLKKCEKVYSGMTLTEAKKTMGDYEYYLCPNRSEIWTYFVVNTYPLNNPPDYLLNYPAPFGASSGTEIHFDPMTQKVTRVICGEGVYVVLPKNWTVKAG